jgi:MFS family permease
MHQNKSYKQGLSQNRYQFILLVLVNAFVGGMVGLERVILPEFAKSTFGISATFAIMSFVMAFGISKAISNYSVAKLTKMYSRKNILILGWLFAIPVPFILMYAPNWNWVVFANILLGINQGLSWSTTVIMKIDLVGSKNRGLAMGINEFAGYLSVGLASYLSSRIAAAYGFHFYPFIPGIIFVFMGLIISILMIKDTTHFVHEESKDSNVTILKNVWKDASWRHKNISTVSINGLVNNMNDAVVWVLLPMLLVSRGFDIVDIGIIAGIYPAVWGLSQLFTGKMGDRYCKKQIITLGMLMQSIAIIILALTSNWVLLIVAAVLLGLGTGLVYPNFLTIVAENSHPTQRAETLSIFRFWRDSGYVIGALFASLLSTQIGLIYTILIMGLITGATGLLAQFRMCCTLKKWWKDAECVHIPAY